MVPRLFNLLCLNLLSLMMAKAYQQITDSRNKAARNEISLYIALALFPNSVYLSSHIYRDTISAFLLVYTFYCSVQIARGGFSISSILKIIATVAIAYWIRAALVAFCAGIICLVFLFASPDNLKYSLKRLAASKALLYIVVMLAFLILAFLYKDTLFGYLERYTDNLSNSSNRIVSVIYSMPLIPLGLPLRFIAYLITPFYYSFVFNPPEWLSSTYAFSCLCISIGTTALVSQYVFFFASIHKTKLLAIITIFLVAGIVLTTFGYRHVLMVYPFLFTTLRLGRDEIIERGAIRQYSSYSLALASVFLFFFSIVFIV